MATTKRKKSPATTKKATTTKPESNVTRIKAKDTPKPVKAAPKTAKKSAAKKPKKRIPVLSSIVGYFVGSWKELRQVHWPNRKSTWGLTIAVVLYTLFFVALIVLLDTVFRYIFDIILGK